MKIAASTLLALLPLVSAASSCTRDPTSTSQPSAPSATPSTTPEPDDEMIAMMRERRMDSIMDYALLSRLPAADIPKWLSTLQPSGQWPTPELDYKTGCEAQRSAWPAAVHWRRLLVMSAAWHGGLKTFNGTVDTGAEQWLGNTDLRDAISRAMGWWFSHDVENVACVAEGGLDECPCGTPGLWSTFYFAGAILVPIQAGQTCLLLDTPPQGIDARLSAEHKAGCNRILRRSYDLIDRGYDWAAGAELFMILRNGVDTALLNNNHTMLQDAYDRLHSDVSIRTDPTEDGIHPDGSFSRFGQLYNGNYGKDYINAFLNAELLAPGTPYLAEQSAIDAFSTMLEGGQWMAYENTKTGVVHWDPSTMSRAFTFAVADNSANSNINVNVTVVGELGEHWDADELRTFSTSLRGKVGDVNAGFTVGSKVFHSMDYLVHRGENYVSTLKMFSSRTKNSECVNGQNPFGFHLSDGLRYTYVHGSEYTDIVHAWDWNLLPGITTDYGATPLSCANITYNGIESFVGGVSADGSAIGAMKYTNPMTQAFGFQKAWFFLPGGREHVMVGNVQQESDAPVFSVLDQKRRQGAVFVDGVDIANASVWSEGGSRHDSPSSLWHDNVGYVFPWTNITEMSANSSVVVKVGNLQGNWSRIGTSRQPPSSVELFAAYIDHGGVSLENGKFAPISYTTFPAISSDEFHARVEDKVASGIQEIRNDAAISAIFDAHTGFAYVVFWTADTQWNVVNIPSADKSSFTLRSDAAVAVIVDTDTWEVVFADPSQEVDAVTLTFGFDSGEELEVTSGLKFEGEGDDKELCVYQGGFALSAM